MIAEVIVDIAHSEIDKVFEYIVDDDSIVVGSRVLVPFGNRVIEGFVINLKEKSDYAFSKLKKTIRQLDKIPALNSDLIDSAKFVVKTYHCTMADALRLFIPSEMRGGKIAEKSVQKVYPSEIDVEFAKEKIGTRAKKQLLAIEDIFSGVDDYTLLCKKYSHEVIASLFSKDLVSYKSKQVNRVPYENLNTRDKNVINLTKSQIDAIDKIDKTKLATTLINGVTGCGKTEIYLNIIDKVLSSGKTAIFLVPEIALTPQNLDKLRVRFGNIAAILHSGLSKGERFDEWWRIRLGEAKVVIGARSAVFAPLENVGVIIIDEEHENTYLSETAPRYHTKTIADYIIKKNAGKLILGSATPSIESYYYALNKEYELIEIKDRINKKAMPIVEIVDLKHEIRVGNKSSISTRLKEEIEKTILAGNQVLLFLNRRGFSSYLQCVSCGKVLKCEDCDVSLTYHKYEDVLKCHYCSKRYSVPTTCPDCKETAIKQGGVGTQKVVEELHSLFDGLLLARGEKLSILRMDNDTTSGKDSHLEIINAFKDKKAQILVGTQMIAKGHNFPDVTLVGILDADMSLYMTDFRSGERTFQLITQVAGRSGRAEKAGKVILQTYSPKHYILDFASKYNYSGFYDYESNIRQVTHFPPFADILRVVLTSEGEEGLHLVTKTVFESIKQLLEDYADSIAYLKAMKSPIKRIQKQFRNQILVRLVGDKRNEVTDLIYEKVKNGRTKSVNCYLEINPNNMT